MTLAPRSWPSRPGLATTTRYGPFIGPDDRHRRPGERQPDWRHGPHRSGASQRCGREEQVLLAHRLEAHPRRRPVALPPGCEHETGSPPLVHHGVAGLEPERLGPGAGTPGRARGVGAEPGSRADEADVAHELGGHLGQEPARDVVRGLPEQGADPGMGQVQASAGPGDPHVAEAPLLLELYWLAQGAQVREDTVFEADEEHGVELEP